MSDFLVNIVRRGAGLSLQMSPKLSMAHDHPCTSTDAEDRTSDSASTSPMIAGAVADLESYQPSHRSFTQDGSAQEESLSPPVSPLPMVAAETYTGGISQKQIEARSADGTALVGEPLPAFEGPENIQSLPNQREEMSLLSEQPNKSSRRKAHEGTTVILAISESHSAASDHRKECFSSSSLTVKQDQAQNVAVNGFAETPELDYSPTRFEPPKLSTHEKLAFTMTMPKDETLHSTFSLPHKKHSITGPDATVSHPRQSWEKDVASFGLEEAATSKPDSDAPRVQVRIGRVEVRMNNLPSEPTPKQPREPRGFDRYALARRYLDRCRY